MVAVVDGEGQRVRIILRKLVVCWNQPKTGLIEILKTCLISWIRVEEAVRRGQDVGCCGIEFKRTERS